MSPAVCWGKWSVWPEWPEWYCVDADTVWTGENWEDVTPNWEDIEDNWEDG